MMCPAWCFVQQMVGVRNAWTRQALWPLHESAEMCAICARNNIVRHQRCAVATMLTDLGNTSHMACGKLAKAVSNTASMIKW